MSVVLPQHICASSTYLNYASVLDTVERKWEPFTSRDWCHLL